MKKTTKKLALTTTTIRDLQPTELAQVVGGSISVIYNPSVGSVYHPSGGAPSMITSGVITSGHIPSGGH